MLLVGAAWRSEDEYFLLYMGAACRLKQLELGPGSKLVHGWLADVCILLIFSCGWFDNVHDGTWPAGNNAKAFVSIAQSWSHETKQMVTNELFLLSGIVTLRVAEYNLLERWSVNCGTVQRTVGLIEFVSWRGRLFRWIRMIPVCRAVRVGHELFWYDKDDGSVINQAHCWFAVMRWLVTVGRWFKRMRTRWWRGAEISKTLIHVQLGKKKREEKRTFSFRP